MMQDMKHKNGLKQIPSLPRKEDDNEVNKTGSDQAGSELHLGLCESQTQQ